MSSGLSGVNHPTTMLRPYQRLSGLNFSIVPGQKRARTERVPLAAINWPPRMTDSPGLRRSALSTPRQRRKEGGSRSNGGCSVMTPEELQAAREAAKEAQRLAVGLEPKRSTYYASWPVERTGGIARYIHGPAGRPVIYYKGPCKDCGDVIVTERQPVRNKVQGNGRWPSYCRSCHQAREAEHNARSKERMRRLREAQRDRREHNDRLLGRTWGGRRKGAGRKPKNPKPIEDEDIY